MEILSSSKSIKIRDIFIDNGNWWKVFLKHHQHLRPAIVVNVIKMLACRTSLLGFHLFSCLVCHFTRKVPHTCKSRLCSPCGKKHTDQWIAHKLNTFPKTSYQHITFTMPSALWDLFWFNRDLLNKIPPIAAGIIKQLAKKQGFIPGIFLAIHTFGRALNRNVHLHLSTTLGGISLNHQSWVSKAYFHHQPIKDMWRYRLITLLLNEFKAGSLKLPTSLRHIKTPETFNSWTSQFFKSAPWVVHLSKPDEDIKKNVEYFGRYIKRPPIGETRIKAYDGHSVSFQFLDHHDHQNKITTLPVLEFISRILYHIPDKYFRLIRYYGFLSNYHISKLLPLAKELLQQTNQTLQNLQWSWRAFIQKSFGIDPLKCPHCQKTMRLSSIRFPLKSPNLSSLHGKIAHGFFQLV